MCSVERIELWNAHCCAFCASVNGADSAVRFASLRFASVCSVNRVLDKHVSLRRSVVLDRGTAKCHGK